MENQSEKSEAREEQKFFLERAKFFRDHVQAVLNLATGSLVLSVTFLHNIGSHVSSKVFLTRAWNWFVVSILLGITYNYMLAIYARSQGKRFGGLLSFLSFVFHLSFVVAITYLALFGWTNME